MSDWTKVEATVYETLKGLGAPTKVETTYYAQVPRSWNNADAPVSIAPPPGVKAPKHRRRSVNGQIVYQRNTLKYKQLNKARYPSGTLAEAVRTAVKSILWAEGIGSNVKTRNDIEIAVSVATRTKRATVSSCISRLIKDGWLILTNEPTEAAAPKARKHQPPYAQWVKATDSIKLGLGRVKHGDDTQAGRCIIALKAIFDKGDMQKVLQRGDVQKRLVSDFHFTKVQSSWLTSELIREGWLRRAGPEQMPAEAQ